MYLGTIHLLKRLTRMQTGNDGNPVSPPPICRLDAYGNYMIKNVPVAVGNFKIELTDGTDYYRITQRPPLPSDQPLTNSSYDIYGQNFVPISSTISMSLVPMYSREEMLNFSVDSWAGGLYNQAPDSDGNGGAAGYL